MYNLTLFMVLMFSKNKKGNVILCRVSMKKTLRIIIIDIPGKGSLQNGDRTRPYPPVVRERVSLMLMGFRSYPENRLKNECEWCNLRPSTSYILAKLSPKLKGAIRMTHHRSSAVRRKHFFSLTLSYDI